MVDEENKRFLRDIEKRVEDKIHSVKIEEIEKQVHKMRVILGKNKAEINFYKDQYQVAMSHLQTLR